MSTMTLEAQTAEKRIVHLLVAMALKVEVAVDQAIGALLNSGTQTVSGICNRKMPLMKWKLPLTAAIFAALSKASCLRRRSGPSRQR